MKVQMQKYVFTREHVPESRRTAFEAWFFKN
jgi:hypothetical protein